MAVFVLSDLHLSTNLDTDKSMEVFGGKWKDYMNRIKTNWNRLVDPSDTVIVNGDVSWAMTLEEAKSDFEFLNSLSGTKIISKGNHDFWWSTVTKLTAFFEKHNIKTIEILNNNAIEVESYVIAGSRGWFTDKSMQNAEENVDYDKIINRESIRLDMSLTSAKKICEQNGKEIIAFLHFPPIWGEFTCTPIMNVLKKHGISKCYFGHVHGSYTHSQCFVSEGITFEIISADFLDFLPRIV
jgi:predicted phosphohydrolase